MSVKVSEWMIPVIGSTVMTLGAVALFLATIRLGRPKSDGKS